MALMGERVGWWGERCEENWGGKREADGDDREREFVTDGERKMENARGLGGD